MIDKLYGKEDTKFTGKVLKDKTPQYNPKEASSSSSSSS
jgi:hypothetical protein